MSAKRFSVRVKRRTTLVEIAYVSVEAEDEGDAMAKAVDAAESGESDIDWEDDTDPHAPDNIEAIDVDEES